MKTADYIVRQRETHHKALESLCTTGLTGLQIWRKLRRLETKANNAACAQCNGEAVNGEPYRSDEEWEQFKEWAIEEKVARIFGKLPDGFFVNGDPRGYALKLDNEKVTIPDGMHKDWGGYGILAPEIN